MSFRSIFFRLFFHNFKLFFPLARFPSFMCGCLVEGKANFYANILAALCRLIAQAPFPKRNNHDFFLSKFHYIEVLSKIQSNLVTIGLVL